MDINIFGYPVSRRGLSGDAEYALRSITSGMKGRYMACANPHSLVTASKDPVFEIALKKANILVPDGAGIVIAAKVMNLPIIERVAGYEFFKTLSDRASNRGGLKYFFLGSSNRVLDLIILRLKNEYPNIAVCGIYSPPFKENFSDSDNATMIDAINRAAPDVLWIGMTAPKQEKWIYQNRNSLNVPFIAAIGAVFDFYAGTKKRSSIFWQKLGLEWFPRFLKEPGRLWERNLKSTPIFLWWVLKKKFRLYK